MHLCLRSALRPRSPPAAFQHGSAPAARARAHTHTLAHAHSPRGRGTRGTATKQQVGRPWSLRPRAPGPGLPECKPSSGPAGTPLGPTRGRSAQRRGDQVVPTVRRKSSSSTGAGGWGAAAGPGPHGLGARRLTLRGGRGGARGRHRFRKRTLLSLYKNRLESLQQAPRGGLCIKLEKAAGGAPRRGLPGRARARPAAGAGRSRR